MTVSLANRFLFWWKMLPKVFLFQVVAMSAKSKVALVRLQVEGKD